MKYTNQHQTKVKDSISVNHRDIHEGDIVSFLYGIEERLAFILNPRFNGMMHAVNLGNVSVPMLTNLLEIVGTGKPHSVYSAHLSKEKEFQDSDAYRTYDIKKISELKLVAYDFGFNKKNKNSIGMIDKSLILGLEYGDDTVLMKKTPQLLPYIRIRAREGVYTPFPNTESIKEYIKDIPKPRFVTTWTAPRSETIADEEYEGIKLQFLKKLLTKGGVFFIPEMIIEKIGMKSL